jgi:hypothetical protein
MRPSPNVLTAAALFAPPADDPPPRAVATARRGASRRRVQGDRGAGTAPGRLGSGDVGVHEQRDAGGVVLRRTELHVDPTGQDTFERRDHTADGTWDQHLWRTWACDA